MRVRRVIYQWIKNYYELVNAYMARTILEEEGNDSLACSLSVQKEEETTSDDKYLQSERALKMILEKC